MILWKQLISKAKDDNVRNVIFVTDDSKEDWWYILESRGKKQIGPHANLQSEIYREAELDIFHMYNTSSFLESGKEILKLGVHESSIQDANTMFLQSIRQATKDLEREAWWKEKERKIFQKTLMTLKDNERYKELISNYEFGSLNKKEVEELRERINRRNEWLHFFKWDDIKKPNDVLDDFEKNDDAGGDDDD